MDINQLELQMNELEILKICEHKNINKLIDIFEDDNNFYLILEYIEGYNFNSYMNQMCAINENKIRSIMK